MAHKLPRLSKTLLESPQLITQSKFKEIADVLDNRSYMEEDYSPDAFIDLEALAGVSIEDKVGPSVGVLRIEGPTTYKPTGWEALCGGCSYVSLIEQMESFVAQGKKTVLMNIDSPGGQAFRMISTAKRLRTLADDNGIKIIAYVDGMMASAAMGLGSAAHEIISNPDSESGSIGVVISLINDSKMLEKEGIERIFITAGDDKVPYEKDGSFRKDFLEDLQDKVNDLYVKFTSHVATLRGINVEDVRNTKARMFKAEKALEIGLIDKIMEEHDFLAYLSEASGNTTPASQDSPKPQEESKMPDLKKKGVETEASEVVQDTVELSVADLQAQLEAAKAELAGMDAMKEHLSALLNKEKEAEKLALTEHLETFSFLSESKESLVSFFMSEDVSSDLKDLMNTVIDSAKTSMEDLKVENDSLLAVADEAVQEAKAESEKIRESFGSAEQKADESVPEIQVEDAKALRKARVAEIKAKKAKK